MGEQREFELNYVKIGKRIRYIRRLRDMSQDELVSATNFSKSHISNIENAKSQLSLDALVRIAHALQTTPNQLLVNEIEDMPDARAKVVLEIIGDSSEKEFMECLELLSLFLKFGRNR